MATIPRDGRHPFSPISQFLPWPDPYFLSSSLLFPIPPPYGPSNSYEIFPSLPVPYREQRPSKSFSCNTYRKQGWGERVVPVGSPSRPRSLPTTHLRFFLFNFLCTPLHSPKTQLFCFQAIPHSLRKTPGGWGTPQVPGAGCRESFIFSHQSRVTSHAFIQTVTCPEGVHRTYYWNRRTPPPKFLQATVTSFTIAGRV